MHMLDRLLAAASDLPVIVQGALGSALFALVLFVGQRAFLFFAEQRAKHSRTKRKRYLVEQQIKYNVLNATGVANRGAFVSLLIYRAARSLFLALLWLSLGLIFGSVLNVLGLVGYFGCVYYLFLGLSTVTGPKKVDDVAEKLQQIKAELESLDGA